MLYSVRIYDPYKATQPTASPERCVYIEIKGDIDMTKDVIDMIEQAAPPEWRFS